VIALYWDRPDESAIADFLAVALPRVRIFEDRHVEEMLREDFPESVTIENLRLRTTS
jgi:hypothetical protein